MQQVTKATHKTLTLILSQRDRARTRYSQRRVKVFLAAWRGGDAVRDTAWGSKVNYGTETVGVWATIILMRMDYGESLQLHGVCSLLRNLKLEL